MIPTETRLTVTQLNTYVKSLLDGDLRLRSVSVTGELSNCKVYYSSGHMYFSLKDEKCALSGVMFRQFAQSLKFTPEDGMKVVVSGYVSVFEREGKYQFYAERMEPDGAGSLAVAFEQLKKKLSAEGLFDPEKKRPLPQFPKKIGVITSEYGAAVKDIFNVLGRRYPLAEVVFCPAVVQGPTAPPSVIEAIEKMNSLGDIDTLIVGRGGGSAEDLWCFNDERLVRAVASSGIPVISAVGHETDFTLCDFAADLRAPTPSAAAELAVPDISDLADTLATLKKRMNNSVVSYFGNEKLKLERYSAAVGRKGFETFCENNLGKINRLVMQLDFSVGKYLDGNTAALGNLCARLEAASPLKIMARGYSTCLSGDRTVRSVNDVAVGDSVKIVVSDGTIDCEVTGTNG